MILLDTGFLFAFLSTDDSHHQAAAATMALVASGKWGQPVVSDLVVAELFNLLRARKVGPELERNAARTLTGKTPLLEAVRFVPAPSGADADKVLATYQKHRRLSFTDVALLDALSRLPSSCLATFDSGFNGLCETVP